MANSNGWGDGSANNAIGWGQGAVNNSNNWGDSHAKSWAGLTDIVGVTTDADAQAFITAAAITDPTQQVAIDTLVKSLKSNNIWTKMKAVYPFVGGTASAHKFNLKDPRDLDAAFRLVFNGGWTHSANGATPNGTNGYADTYFNPSIQSTPTNVSGGVYSRTNSVVQSASFGAIETSGQGLGLYIKLTDNNTYVAANDWAGTGVANIVSNTTGFYIVNRFSDVLKKLYRNNSTIMSVAPVVSTVANSNVYFGARNITGSGASLYDTRNYSFFFLGNSLTDTEAANLYTAVQAFQTSLSRQV